MKDSVYTLPVISINRHRLKTDGVGVSTLVGAYSCPLSCKYCLNPVAWNPDTLKKCRQMSAQELYDHVKIDDLYFLATNGGITFGGGESLLHADFISAFREVCGPKWRLTVESSLNVPTSQLEKILPVIDDYIIDIKTMNPDIYQAYTGKDNSLVLKNLKLLRAQVQPEHIRIRIPLIPDYNTKEDTDRSVSILKEMGFTDLEVFPYVQKGF